MKTVFNCFKFTPSQIKVIEEFENNGWQFEEEYSNGNEECDFKYKSPRMSEFIDMSPIRKKLKRQLLKTEAYHIAFKIVKDNETKILDHFRDKIYSQLFDNQNLKPEDMLYRLNGKTFGVG